MALSWKKLALAVFGFNEAETNVRALKVNADRELHTADSTLRTNVGEKDAPAVGTLLERLEQLKTTVASNTAVVNAITTLQTELKGASNSDLTTLETAVGGLKGGSGKTLSDIWNSLQTQREISTSLWTDDSEAKYVRRDVVDETDGTITVSFTDEAGAAATPGAGLRPLASTDKETVESLFTATAGGTGYVEGDVLARVLVIDTSVSPPDISATWMNVSDGTVIAAPTAGTFQQNLGLTDSELRAADVKITLDGETVALSAATLSALENISVDNFPTEYPLPAAQVTTLAPQTNALTDTELRATPVPVSGTLQAQQDGSWTVALDTATLAALETINIGNEVEITLNGEEVTVNGTIAATQSGGWTVALDTASLAALETITVNQGTSPWVVSGTVTATPSGTQNVDVTGNTVGLATSAKQLADNHNVTVSNPTANPETGLAKDAKQLADNHNVKVSTQPNTAGTWGYASGTSGTVTLTGSKRVLQITAVALESAGSITINGGDTITIPYGSTDSVSTGITIEPKGNLTDPVLVFTDTDSYFVEYVS